MPASNLPNLTNLATPQPTMLMYAVISPYAAFNDNRKITANALLQEITANITDVSVQFGDGVAAAVSAAGKGKIAYNNTAKVFQASVDGGKADVGIPGFHAIVQGLGVEMADAGLQHSQNEAPLIGQSAPLTTEEISKILHFTVHHWRANGALIANDYHLQLYLNHSGLSSAAARESIRCMIDGQRQLGHARPGGRTGSAASASSNCAVA